MNFIQNQIKSSIKQAKELLSSVWDEEKLNQKLKELPILLEDGYPSVNTFLVISQRYIESNIPENNKLHLLDEEELTFVFNYVITQTTRLHADVGTFLTHYREVLRDGQY